MEPVVSACASAIDPLMWQCLKEWNGAKEIVEKHLVILLLYVVTEAHDYVSSHSQLTDLTSAPSLRVWAFWLLLLNRQAALVENHLFIY